MLSRHVFVQTDTVLVERTCYCYGGGYSMTVRSGQDVRACSEGCRHVL